MPRTHPPDAADLAVAALRSELENQSTRLTEIAAGIRGLSLNSVLLSELVTIPAAGRTHRDTSTAYAMVGVVAYGAAQVVVDSGPEQAAAPAAGIGTIRVPAGGAIVWPLAGSTLSIYAAEGTQLLLALWSKPQHPLFVRGLA
jgi:hypothetical protein